MADKTKAELRKEKYDDFRKVLTSFYNETMTVSQESLKELDDRINRLSHRLARLYRERDGLEMRLQKTASLDAANCIFDTAFPDQIVKMEMENKLFVVHTSEISLTMEIPATGQYVDIPVGEFRIEIRWQINETGVSDMTVKAFNKTHPASSGRDHPHVSGGQICWGDLTEVVVAKRSIGAVSELIDLTIMLLMSYNPGSAFVSLLSGWGHRLPREKAICVRCIKPINMVKVGTREIKCLCAPQDVQQHTPNPTPIPTANLAAVLGTATQQFVQPTFTMTNNSRS